MMLASSMTENLLESGCDEAGRGCLAGAVFAAAVILPKNFYHPLLNDSKQLTPNQRNELRKIIESEALAWSVANASPNEIDQMNILNASILAMHRALEQLHLQPELILVDGNRFYPYRKIPHHTVVKGDARFASIAAASILAKTYRDDAMRQLHVQYPQYDWAKNAGYPTAAHRAAIEKWGATPHHRKSFHLLPKAVQLKLFS